MTMTRSSGCFIGVVMLALAAATAGAQRTVPARPAAAPVREPDEPVLGTFSIVAADPENGVCGAAIASKYPAVGKVAAYVRGGVGAFVTQAQLNRQFGDKALDLLADDKLPEEVLAELLKEDNRRDSRQLAIIDMKGRAANRNAINADPYWGAMAGRNYSCQGNLLVGRDVLVAMAKAFEETKGSLTDRLMASLIAGDCAGGDNRGRLAAGIRVGKKDVDGFWLELQVDKSNDAVIDLAKKYAELKHDAKGDWAGGKTPFEHPCPKRDK
jgi:uncharacterized Ntn-hydrolase superfamily protein